MIGVGKVAIVFAAALYVVGACHAEILGPGQTFRDCDECPDMVVVPPGSFFMGSSEEEASRVLAMIPDDNALLKWIGIGDRARASKFLAFERPQRTVNIERTFAIGIHPVTVGEFSVFVRETGKKTGKCTRSGSDTSVNIWHSPGFPQTEGHPVTFVTWNDAAAYILWLNRKVATTPNRRAVGYRLPSEAEWEYAARGGSTTARWWGEDIVVGFANCDGCGTPTEPSIRGTTPVKFYPANSFGLYDVIGNVANYVEDCWHDSLKSGPISQNPWLEDNCSIRVAKGSSWQSRPWSARSATRFRQYPDGNLNLSGFRVAAFLEGQKTHNGQATGDRK